VPAAPLLPTVTQGPQATFTPRPTPSPAPSATKGPAYAVVTLRWNGGPSIADVDDVMEIASRLKEHPGIIDGYGDEIQITITYNPQLTSPAAIQKILLDSGYPTRAP
jgi:hypothetical protein